MKRGEVHLAALRPPRGSKQRGRRPVVVVSHDAFNATPGWRSIIVVPVSRSTKQARRGPTAVALAAGAGGLEHDSIALCHQVTTLDRSKLEARLGELDGREVEAIESGLRAALELV